MLNKIIATAHLVGMNMVESTRKRMTTDTERGSYTVELVVVLAAIVLIAVGVTAVIKTNVDQRVADIFDF